MADLSSSASASIAHYARLAEGYDKDDGGWHVGLGLDFVKWLAPKPGSICLDLACGTDLVAIPLAEAIGPSGHVIGVDVTKAMLDGARNKTPNGVPPNGGAKTRDIMDLDTIKEIEDIVKEKGGFDIISCCSALVLLSSPRSTITSWSRLLKPGTGRLIIDTPTEDKALLHLLTQELRSATTPPLSNEFNWQWIKGPHSLEEMFEKAGLVVKRTWTTGTAKAKVYGKGQVDEVFDEQLEKYSDFMKVSNVDELRVIFHEHWESNLGPAGTYRDEAKLYVTLGNRP